MRRPRRIRTRVAPTRPDRSGDRLIARRGAGRRPTTAFGDGCARRRGAGTLMRKLLLQLDSSRLASVFDRVVAYDGGADAVMSYGGVAPAGGRGLGYGCLFTRGPQDPKETAGFIGGAGMARREQRPTDAARALEGAVLVLNAGPAGVMLLPRQAWANRPGVKAVADVNAVPPLGIEGVDTMDDGVTKDGVVCFGALAIGNLKMKVHKACIARLFERNDLVLDAETIADVARELMAQKK